MLKDLKYMKINSANPLYLTNKVQDTLKKLMEVNI